MLKLVSKTITALRSNPRIDEIYFELVEEQLNGRGPLDPSKKNYDSSKPRLTHIDQWLGMGGSEDRAHSVGVGVDGREDYLHKDRGLSSGYNMDGDGPISDETGPGNTHVTPDPYYTVRTNELFLDHELKGGNADERTRIDQHVRKVLNGPAVTLPHRRLPVDRRMK